jgi:hypothetical protein
MPTDGPDAKGVSMNAITCSRSDRRAGFLRVGVMTSLTVLAGCGGGGDDADWLYPLWVETDVLVADVDGDGRADVITIAQLAASQDDRKGQLVVHLQTSPGVFAAAQTYEVGKYPWQMALGDIDGDGAPDLVITDAGDANVALGEPNNGTVWMLRQDADNRGQFLPPQQLAINTTYPSDVVIGDVTGDNVPDIVVTGTFMPDKGAGLLVQDENNRGTFLPSALIPLPGNATAVAIGDVNGDDRNDLAFRMYLSSVNYVWSTALGIVYQQADGTLAPVETWSPQTGLNTQTLAVIHYDNNGLADVVEFFTPSGAGYSPKVTTLLQSPLNSFAAVNTSLAGVSGVDDGVVADLNGDGHPDFASVGTYPVGTPSKVYSTLYTFMQNGSGGFSQTASISLPVLSSRVAAGDVNGDGLNDLVVLGGDNQVMVLLQSSTTQGTFLAPQHLN